MGRHRGLRAAAIGSQIGLYHYDALDHAVSGRPRRGVSRSGGAKGWRGELTEEEFKPLRLMNGLYLQLHGYMLRCAIPYGVLSADQLRRFAHIGRVYDRGYGHFTTRQNIQFNWDQAGRHAGHPGRIWPRPGCTASDQRQLHTQCHD